MTTVNHPGQGWEWTCPLCDTRESDVQSLRSHLHKSHCIQNISYRCSSCDFMANTARAVSTHMRYCKGPKSREVPEGEGKCELCKFTSVTLQGLQVHMSQKHKREYNDQLPKKRSTLWSELEAEELARAEVQNEGSRSINKTLHSLFPL